MLLCLLSRVRMPVEESSEQAWCRRMDVWPRGARDPAHAAHRRWFFGGEPLPDMAPGRGKGVRAEPRALEEPPTDDKRQERVQSAPNGSTDTVVHEVVLARSLGPWCTRAVQRGWTKNAGGHWAWVASVTRWLSLGAEAEHPAGGVGLPRPRLRHGVPHRVLIAPLWSAVVRVPCLRVRRCGMNRQRATRAGSPPQHGPRGLDVAAEGVACQRPDRLAPLRPRPGAYRETVCHVSPALALGSDPPAGGRDERSAGWRRPPPRRSVERPLVAPSGPRGAGLSALPHHLWQ